MGIIETVFSGNIILATLTHGFLILAGFPLLEWIRHKLEHDLLMLLWGKFAFPLYQAFLIGLFVYIAYPVIFGLSDAVSISSLLTEKDGRINSIINVLFLISIFFPFLPVLGKQSEFILPVQGITCCMMVFSWLAESMQLAEYSYWPGIYSLILIILAALLTHWLCNHLASRLGAMFDKKFHVDGSHEIVGRAIILFMQVPAILIYSLSLGSQIQQ